MGKYPKKPLQLLGNNSDGPYKMKLYNYLDPFRKPNW